MTRILLIILQAIVFMLHAPTTSAQKKSSLLQWSQLAPIPDANGFAGSFAGVSHGALLVAGGANFPNNGRPWKGDTKTWHDAVFVLEQKAGTWKKAGKLPKPSGYGISISYNNKLICIGGGNAEKNFTDVISLEYKSGRLQVEELPSLPLPLINACGALVGDCVFVFGGIETPTANQTTKHFFSLNLSASVLQQKWKEEKAFPGKDRMLATAGSNADAFYVFGGVQLVQGDTGNAARREYLKDAWKFSQKDGWVQIADLPTPIAGAPSPAFASAGKLFVFGGDDGVNAAATMTLKDKHPGFRKEVLCYNTKKNTWTSEGNVLHNIKPDAEQNPGNSVYVPVTTPVVVWNGDVIIPGGEARPAVRSNKVLVGRLNKKKSTKQR